MAMVMIFTKTSQRGNSKMQTIAIIVISKVRLYLSEITTPLKSDQAGLRVSRYISLLVIVEAPSVSHLLK